MAQTIEIPFVYFISICVIALVQAIHARRPPVLVRRLPITAGRKQDVFSLPEGEVVLQWPEPLSSESYEDFESWLKLVLRKVKRAVQEPEKAGEVKS